MTSHSILQLAHFYNRIQHNVVLVSHLYEFELRKAIPARAGTVLVGGDEYYGGKWFRLWGWRVFSPQNN